MTVLESILMSSGPYALVQLILVAYFFVGAGMVRKTPFDVDVSVV